MTAEKQQQQQQQQQQMQLELHASSSLTPRADAAATEEVRRFQRRLVSPLWRTAAPDADAVYFRRQAAVSRGLPNRLQHRQQQQQSNTSSARRQQRAIMGAPAAATRSFTEFISDVIVPIPVQIPQDEYNYQRSVTSQSFHSTNKLTHVLLPTLPQPDSDLLLYSGGRPATSSFRKTVSICGERYTVTPIHGPSPKPMPAGPGRARPRTVQQARFDEGAVALGRCRLLKRSSEILPHRVDRMYFMSGASLSPNGKYGDSADGSESERYRQITEAVRRGEVRLEPLKKIVSSQAAVRFQTQPFDVSGRQETLARHRTATAATSTMAAASGSPLSHSHSVKQNQDDATFFLTQGTVTVPAEAATAASVNAEEPESSSVEAQEYKIEHEEDTGERTGLEDAPADAPEMTVEPTQLFDEPQPDNPDAHSEVSEEIKNIAEDVDVEQFPPEEATEIPPSTPEASIASSEAGFSAAVEETPNETKLRDELVQEAEISTGLDIVDAPRPLTETTTEEVTFERQTQRGDSTSPAVDKQSADQRADQSADQNADQSAGQSADQSAGQSADQSAGQSADQSADQSAGKSADQSAGQSADQSAGQSADQSADQSAGQSADQSAGQSADQSAGQSADQSVDQSAGQSSGQSATMRAASSKQQVVPQQRTSRQDAEKLQSLVTRPIQLRFNQQERTRRISVESKSRIDKILSGKSATKTAVNGTTDRALAAAGHDDEDEDTDDDDDDDDEDDVDEEDDDDEDISESELMEMLEKGEIRLECDRSVFSGVKYRPKELERMPDKRTEFREVTKHLVVKQEITGKDTNEVLHIEPNMTSEQADAFVKLFDELDVNKDGRIAMEEVQKRLDVFKSKRKTDVKKFIRVFDLNGDRTVDVREFLAVAALNDSLCKQKTTDPKADWNLNLDLCSYYITVYKEMFEMADQSKNGKLGLEELMVIVAVSLDADSGTDLQLMEDVLNSIDRDHSDFHSNQGEIDFVEYLTYIPVFLKLHQFLLKKPMLVEDLEKSRRLIKKSLRANRK